MHSVIFFYPSDNLLSVLGPHMFGPTTWVDKIKKNPSPFLNNKTFFLHSLKERHISLNSYIHVTLSLSLSNKTPITCLEAEGHNDQMRLDTNLGCSSETQNWTSQRRPGLAISQALCFVPTAILNASLCDKHLPWVQCRMHSHCGV